MEIVRVELISFHVLDGVNFVSFSLFFSSVNQLQWCSFSIGYLIQHYVVQSLQL